MDATVDCLVVGAGLAGIASALALKRAGRDVLLVEAGSGPGGVARSDRIDGFLVERGPNTVLARPPLCAALAAEGLDDMLLRAAPASRKRFLWRAGRLVPVPMGPLSFLGTPLLSAAAKLRLLAEPFVRRGDAADESVAEFFTRRMGSEVATGLVGPFLTGVYAGDERQLGAEAVFPALVELEREHGSIARGAVARALRARGERSPSGTFSTRDGLGGLAHALAARLDPAPRYGCRVLSLERDGEGWRVALREGEVEHALRAQRLIVATPAGEAARLLAGCDPVAAKFAEAVRYAPVVSVALGVAVGDFATPVEGFGFLVPRDESLRLLGCLFMSQLYPERAPAGRELLQCLVGGVRAPGVVDEPDDVLRRNLGDDLERSLGLRKAPQVLAIRRWPNAVAQPDRTHTRRLRELRRHLATQRSLRLAGGYLAGVSVPDAIESGSVAARELLAD